MTWRVAAGTLRGAREENQDAHALTPHGAGVFDGVAGAPHGKAAAQAAADGLARALEEADPLAALDRRVSATGGASTAIVARWGNPIDIWSVGDSLAFVVDDRLEPVTPVDRAGRLLTQCLGRPFQGHHRRVRLAPGQRLLLCTDGVSDVLGPESMADYMAPDLDDSVDRLLDAVADAGAPDNATVVLAAHG